MDNVVDNSKIDPLIPYVFEIGEYNMFVKFKFPKDFEINFFQTARMMDGLEFRYYNDSTIMQGNFRDRDMFESFVKRIKETKKQLE